VEHALGLAGALIIRHVRQVPDAGCVPRLRLDPAGAAARHRTPRSPMSSSRGRPAKNADGPAIRSPCVPIGRHTPTTKSKRRLRVNPVRRPSLSSCRRCVARAVETRSRGGLGRSVQADKVDQSGGPMRGDGGRDRYWRWVLQRPATSPLGWACRQTESRLVTAPYQPRYPGVAIAICASYS
jgi:hypothetical protein